MPALVTVTDGAVVANATDPPVPFEIILYTPVVNAPPLFTTLIVALALSVKVPPVICKGTVLLAVNDGKCNAPDAPISSPSLLPARMVALPLDGARSVWLIVYALVRDSTLNVVPLASWINDDASDVLLVRAKVPALMMVLLV